MPMQSHEPATGALLWEGEAGDVGAAVHAARAAASSWAATPLTERIVLIRAYRAVVEARAEALADLIARETGKPLWEARTEVASVIAKVDISITAQAERAGLVEREAAGATQAVRHKPHGVLVVLGPYNFPAHLPNGHIVPALLAGNTILFKPSEQTPAVGEFLGQCWAAAGLPDGVLTVVQGGAETGRALISHPDIDGVLFTGSANAGTAIHRQFAGDTGKLLALEMGGNNPLVAWDVADADVEAAATIIVHSAFLSAGQRCTCARRLIVEDGKADTLVAALDALTARLRVGAPFDTPEPFMGPVIDRRAADHLLTAQARMIDAGAVAIRTMTALTENRPFLTPGILDMTGVAMSDEELFGPLLQIVRVGDFAAAMAAANDTRFGLSAGLIGGDRALYDRFWRESRAGIVNWNRPTTGAASSAPFGGVGLSGNHRPSAYYAADYAAWPVASLEAARIAAVEIKGLEP
ncbi:MAG: succinylglutamate-semialdehyde dehydrogenase [Sphingobium sp.]